MATDWNEEFNALKCVFGLSITEFKQRLWKATTTKTSPRSVWQRSVNTGDDCFVPALPLPSQFPLITYVRFFSLFLYERGVHYQLIGP